MNVSNRQQLLGIVAIAAVVLLAGDRLILSPLIKMWKERSSQIAQLRNSVQQGTRLIERDKTIRERWNQMRTNTLATEKPIAQSQVLAAFDHWSQDSRVTVTAVTPHWNSSSGEDYSTLECRVDASGNLGAITRFLYEIEKDSLGLKMDLVEITTRDDRGRELTLGLQVSGLQLNSMTP